MGYVKIYHGRSDVDIFVLIPDHRHLARTIECIAKSAPTSELVDTLLHFSPWQMTGSEFRYNISTQGPVFLGWLEAQASHELFL